MKRLFQLVGFAIAAMLAVQPALADILCRADGVPQMATRDCCADSAMSGYVHGASIHDGQSAAPIRRVAQMQSNCDESCCTVAPQQAPLPSAPEKMTSVRAQAVEGGVLAVPAVITVARASQGSYPHTPGRARRLLLNIFRI